jgi:23S rRNA (guanine745-N1)-methyltransferase
VRGGGVEDRDLEVRLACTVRGCALPLSHEGASVLRCARGHAFDRAREGYWNLLQPQDRRSREAGDSRSALEARRRWLARGLSDPLLPAAADLAQLERLAPHAVVADLGCGEGSMTRGLLHGRDLDVCGIDLSARAVSLAARAWPEATWIVGNADRFVPLPAASVDLVLSLYGRRPAEEMARVLHEGGRLVVAVPGDDDLLELRAAAGGRAEHRDRVGTVLEELSDRFSLAARTPVRWTARLDREAIEDALAMTYRGARRRERERLAGIDSIEVRLSAELLRFEPTTFPSPSREEPAASGAHDPSRRGARQGPSRRRST